MGMVRGFATKLASLTLIVAGVIAAQSAPPRKDIPAIAKAANGAIVTIITAVNDRPVAQGTGFLVSADGVIVTNYHVIETGNIAIVKFPDDTAFPVEGVLASDKVRDLAIIKIHGETFRTLALGDSDDIQVGEEVVAIGNPLSLESTVSNGIISGVRTSKELGQFLQTTAPISPGSSGGPLFNMRGEVVGINTLYLEGGENLNFAIPIDDAKRLLQVKSSKLQDLPNETEPVRTQAREGDALPSASKASLKDTLQWMHNSLRDEGMSPVSEGSASFTELKEFSGCRVHFTVDLRYHEDGGEEAVARTKYFFNLRAIDPTNDIFPKYSEGKTEPPGQPGEEDWGSFVAMTTNNRKTVSRKDPVAVTLKTEKLEHESLFVISFWYPGYGVRFSEAFRHAVNLCDGKPSTF